MTQPDTLSPLENAIRHSVLTDSFAATERLFGQYTAEVERVLKSLPVGSSELPALARRTQVLFEWSSALIQASRGYAAAELAQVRRISQYREQAQYLRIRAEA